jgi:N utilization substance protein B
MTFAPGNKPGKKQPAEGAKPRSLARMAAVQALYQMDHAGTGVEQVIEEFALHRFSGAPLDADGEQGGSLEGADATFFADIVRGVVRRQREIDPLVDHQLATGWRLVRVDAILRAILRAGVLELFDRADVPARVVINEYINVAHAFFEGDEPRVVNGVLDRIAHRLRAAEFKGEEG